MDAGRAQLHGQEASELRSLRERIHGCVRCRDDALFELTDAGLVAGPVPSPPHLSLAVDAAVGFAAGSVRDAFARRPGLHALLDRVAAGVFAVLAAALLVEALL